MGLFFAVVMGSVAILFGVLALIWIVKQFMFICRPNELLVFSGRKNRLEDGTMLGYRMISSATGKGRGFRVPFLEDVKRIDLAVMEVEVSCRNAFCRGGVRLNVDAIANVKISSEPRIVRNAIERFLGQDRHEVLEVAKNTLEGHLRAVVASLTPEEVNEDRLKFSERLSHEAETDLNKLGLHLDTFNIHSVGDIQGSSYLAEIGRKSIAEVLKTAEVFEADCERAATEAEADAKSRSDVAREQAEQEIRTKKNNLDEEKAKLEAAAKSAEEEAEAARETARARAELELQQVRSELEAKRLQAEVVVKAQAQTRAKEFQARAEAAPILERGKAMAGSLDLVRQAWAEAGEGAKPIFMIQQIDTILRQVVGQVQNIRVGTVDLIDKGDGSSLPAYVASYPATVNAILRELDQVTGIDVVGSLGNTLDPASQGGVA
ncbi:MAG TPA: flotillin [Planctomycetes bacterium]|nr:flotillin [Planctomycetota bacterium]